MVGEGLTLLVENMVDDERYLAVELGGLGSDVRSPSVLK